jgi:hypothetical protein
VGVQGIDERTIDLKHGLAAGEDDETCFATNFRTRIGERGCVLKAPTAGAVGTDKIRVAELAISAGPVGFAAGPQVAAGKATENSRAARVCALAL